MVRILIVSDSRYPIDRKIVRCAVEDTFGKNKIDKLDAEVSVAVVGGRKMSVLTKRYLGDDKKHQILTFPFEEVTQKTEVGFVNPPDDILRLGDIVLCWPQVLKEASQDDIMVDDEIYNLICHGVEHLLGKQHE